MSSSQFRGLYLGFGSGHGIFATVMKDVSKFVLDQLGIVDKLRSGLIDSAISRTHYLNAISSGHRHGDARRVF